MLSLEDAIDRILNEHFPNGLPVSRTNVVRLKDYHLIVPDKKPHRKRIVRLKATGS